MKFIYETPHLTVTYTADAVYSREVTVIVGDETRVDTITPKQAAYIQSVLNETVDENTPIQEIGNKVCEIYYSIII